MSYLVDTDVAAGWLKGRQPETRLLADLKHEGLAISLMTYGELYEGIYYGRDPQANERIFHSFLRWVNVAPLNRQIMRRFARIRGELRRTGQRIGDPDILIAATALYYDLVLITYNTRHFTRIPDLRLYRSSDT